MTVGERIKARREELGLTLEQVARKLGVNKSTISRYETSYIEKLPITALLPLAKVLQTSPAYFLVQDESAKTIEISSFDNIFPIKTQKIPLLGEIACGTPIYANEDRESYVLAGTEIAADFCLKAKGDSMINARINDGDIVFIRKQSIVDNGEIAAVIIEDTATLKRVYYYPDKQKLVLQAENPKYEPLVFIGDELEQVHILGKAISFQSDID